MDDSKLHIGVLVERRYLGHLQPAGAISALRARGHRVTVIDPDSVLLGAGEGALINSLELHSLDLLVIRGRSLSLLCLLATAEVAGLRTINRLSGISAVVNKAEMGRKLAANNIPTPRAYFDAIDRLAERVVSYPLILKPVFGDNAQGLKVVDTAQELVSLEWEEPVALAQQYIPNDGYDLKLYAIGREMWAVRKPSPLSGLRPAGNLAPNGHMTEAELVRVSPDVTELGRRCGEIFDLELYGVDCVVTANGPMVIEVNEFPNYTGVPNADARLAEYVIGQAIPSAGGMSKGDRQITPDLTAIHWTPREVPVA